MGTLFDLTKQPLNDVGSANERPMLLREAVEGQTGIPIAVQALNGGGIDLLIFGDEGNHFLIGFLTAGLIEDGFEFWTNLLLLFFGDLAQHIVHFVFDTPLALGVENFSSMAFGMALFPSVIHKSTVCIPRSLRSTSKSSQAVWFSRSPTVKANTAFSLGIDPDHHQNGHFAAIFIVNDGEIGAIGEDIQVMCL